MNKEELKISIAQNKTDQGRLQSEAEQLQSELAALAEPELRHGDYGDFAGSPGYTHGGNIWLKDQKLTLRPFNKAQMCASLTAECEERDKGPFTIFGNIFVDLAARSKPLERFIVKRDKSNILKAYLGICDDGDAVQIEAICRGKKTTVLFNLSEAAEIAHNILREVATAKRKAAQT